MARTNRPDPELQSGLCSPSNGEPDWRACAGLDEPPLSVCQGRTKRIASATEPTSSFTASASLRSCSSNSSTSDDRLCSTSKLSFHLNHINHDPKSSRKGEYENSEENEHWAFPFKLEKRHLSRKASTSRRGITFDGECDREERRIHPPPFCLLLKPRRAVSRP